MNMNMRTVLVVDDVEMNLQLAQKLLEGWGLHVLLATNGKEAISIFNRSKVDVILMDIQMPEMDGLQATKRIREFSDVPVIALTANTSAEETDTYKSIGMNDFLAKPIDERKLLELLSTYMQIQAIGTSSKKEPGATPMYDFKLVEEIAGGDQEFIKRMMGMFVDTAPGLLSDLKLNIEAGNWDKASKIAHRMKSTIDSMNIKAIKVEIRQIETNGKQQVNLDEMPALLDRVSTVLTECIESVRKELE
jgi:CheY-like chemotaxis protein/HPt (histidine-containing phosphotransfer) domain-containing protein